MSTKNVTFCSNSYNSLLFVVIYIHNQYKGSVNLFSQRLKQLRIDKKWTQAELASLLNISPKTVGTWERGTREPPMDAIIKIAQIFNVTTDYLLGRVNNPHEDLLIAAHMDDNLTEKQIEEINKFIEFQKQEYIKDKNNKLKKD